MMRRSSSVLLTAIFFSFFGIPQTGKLFAEDNEIKPEEVVSKHLESLGGPEALAAIKSRVVIGSASAEFIQGDFGNLPNGKSLIASEPRRLAIAMKFGAINYPGEYFAFDGQDATVGYLDIDTKSRLGAFVTQFSGLMEEGLLGGTLSVAWPLLDFQKRPLKLEYRKRKFEGRQFHELTYNPESRSGLLGLQIRLLFNPETFRHVMTEYSHSYIDYTPHLHETSVGISITRSIEKLLQEEFDDFRKVDGLMLPHRYTVKYTEDPNPFIGRWIIQAEQWLHNAQFKPELFKAQLFRTPN